MLPCGRSVAIGEFTFTLDEALIINYGGFGAVLRAHAGERPVAVKFMVASAPHIAAAAMHEREVLTDRLPPHASIVGLRSYKEATGADAGVRAVLAAVQRSLWARSDDEIARKHRLHAPLLESHTVHLMAYELLEGTTLFEIVSRRPTPLSDSEAAAHFWQLASAVAHCHAHAIAHLDLKLENVLLERSAPPQPPQSPQSPSKRSPPPRVVLLDFGLARSFPLPQPLTDLAHPPGSP
eukprot:4994338-Prymnesium_polylepis.1